MKAVLLSIKPKYCELIANGKKTLEIRKTKPKLKPPFKCLIYCTKPKHPHEDYITIEPQCSYEDFVSLDSEAKKAQACRAFYGGGKVIGEFICDEIYLLDKDSVGFFVKNDERSVYLDEDKQLNACISEKEMIRYLDWRCGYAWHITNLIIYDKPKELSEFFIVDKKAVKECSLRERIYTNPDYTHGVCLPGTYICNKDPVDVDFCRGGCWKKSLTRPPQSWCYVEEKNSVNI